MGKLVELSGLQPLASGQKRLVFTHPDDPSLVIKVMRPEFRPRDGQSTSPWSMLVLRYYFRELRYQKATVRVYSFNEASIRLHEKLGFQHEGRIRRTVYTNGALCDEIVLGLTVEELGDG